MDDKKKIVERIAKLMMLGKGNNSENESLAAMQKAQELMKEWSITQTEVDAVSGNKPKFIRNEINLSHGNFKGWERNLLHIVALNNSCRVLFTLKSNQASMFGTDYDQEMTIVFYQFIRVQMLGYCDVAFAKAKSYTNINGKAWKNSYFGGMLLKVQQSLDKAQKTIEMKYENYPIVPTQAPKPNPYALMVLKDRQIEDFYKETAGPVSNIQKTPIRSENAFQQGYKDGSHLALA